MANLCLFCKLVNFLVIFQVWANTADLFSFLWTVQPIFLGAKFYLFYDKECCQWKVYCLNDIRTTVSWLYRLECSMLEWGIVRPLLSFCLCGLKTFVCSFVAIAVRKWAVSDVQSTKFTSEHPTVSSFRFCKVLQNAN